MQTLQPIPIPTDRELTVVVLPSAKQLQLLMEQKGRKALVCYAWRNALRVMPLIAYRQLNDSWQHDTLRHSFALVRVLALLQNFLRGNRAKVDFRAAAADAAADAAAAAAARAAAYAAAAAAAAADAAADAAGYAAARAAAYAGDADLEEAIILQSLLDFNALIGDASSEALTGKSLWQQEPQIWPQLIQKLQEGLEKTGLGFLLGDVENLLGGKVFERQLANSHERPINQPSDYSLVATAPIAAEQIVRYQRSLDFSDDVYADAQSFQALFEGDSAQDNPAVRVLLVGPGGAGKTSLFHLLKNRQPSPSPKVTVAINIATMDLAAHRKAGVDIDNPEDFRERESNPMTHNGNRFDNFEILQWDFGGQSTFYNLHRGFMRRENCVYVLVVDSRHEQAPDDWLAQIQHYAQSDGSREPARVLVVTNSYEGIDREQNTRYLERKFPDLLNRANLPVDSAFFTLNCTKDDDRFNEFLQDLLITCKDSQYLISPTSRQAIEKIRGKFKDSHTMTEARLARECFDLPLDSDEFKAVKNSLQNLGYILDLAKPVDSNLGDTQAAVEVTEPKSSDPIILDPAWITSLSYQAINHPYLKYVGGKITKKAFIAEVIDKCWDSGSDNSRDEDEYRRSAEQQLVITFLVRQEVAYSFKQRSQQQVEEYLFFPDAAPALEPSAVGELFPSALSRTGDGESRSIMLEYHLPIFPMGFKSHLAISLLQKGHIKLAVGEADQPADIWRDGLMASFAHGVKIAVFYEPAKHKLVLKCAYSSELPSSFTAEQPAASDDSTDHKQGLPEQVLAEPLRIMHNAITDEKIMGKFAARESEESWLENEDALFSGQRTVASSAALYPLLIETQQKQPDGQWRDAPYSQDVRDAIFAEMPGYKTMEIN